jgi:hypothetical protein
MEARIYRSDRQLQLVEDADGVRNDDKGIKALAHSLLNFEFSEGQSPFKFALFSE